MDFHIDRKVILNQESEYESLYNWSLQELDAEGNKIGRDQIPWDWTLYFTATELALLDHFEIGQDYESDDPEKKTVSEQQSIVAKLSPGDTRVDRPLLGTGYSMFGTDRNITDFSLNIRPITEEEEQEKCMAWGCVSYTAEADFIDETNPDTVLFYLSVSQATFARYAAMISSAEVDEAVFSVSGVAGFYSEWTPSISTNSIKVLTRGREHEVHIPELCKIDPPRLGEVSETNLHLRRVIKLKTEMTDDSDEWLQKEENL